MKATFKRASSVFRYIFELIVYILMFFITLTANSLSSDITVAFSKFLVFVSTLGILYSLYNLVASIINPIHPFKTAEFIGLNVDEYLQKSTTTLESGSCFIASLNKFKKEVYEFKLGFTCTGLILLTLVEVVIRVTTTGLATDLDMLTLLSMGTLIVFYIFSFILSIVNIHKWRKYIKNMMSK